MLSLLKIAIVVPDLAAGHGVPTVAFFLHRIAAGSGRYSPYLISLAASAADRCSVRLLSPNSWLKGPNVVDCEWRGIRYRHVGSVFSELEFQRYRPRRALNQLLQGFDLVQVVAGAPAWACVASSMDKPTVLQVATRVRSERTSRLKREKGFKRWWHLQMTNLASRMELSALARMDMVFVENQRMYEHISTIIPRTRVRFAPPGVDTDLFCPHSYQPDGCILSVGRFSDPRKNVRLLFDAYAHVCRASTCAPELVLVGDPPSPSDMAYLHSLGVGERISVFKDVSQSELVQHYRAARLFVLSADEEGLGLVILEAMATGLPVVSTDCGGPSTSVVNGETGVLTPVGDAHALAQALASLMRNPTLARAMGERARQRALERFSLHVAGRPFLQEYDSLLGL